MRLIDADSLLENIVHLNNVYVQGRMAYIIDNQPTAYNVEAVAAELEKIKKVSACDEIRCDECKYTKICFEGEKSYKVALDKAISIVRGKE